MTRRFRQHLEDDWLHSEGDAPIPHFGGNRIEAKLDSNENPYAPPIDLGKIVASTPPNRYPDSDMLELRCAIADHVGVAPENIVVGNGCDELIDLLIRTTLDPGDALIDCPPTFVMYRRYAEVSGIKVIDAPRSRTYEIIPKQIHSAVAQGGRLLFLCNPNNPTGTIADPLKVKPLCQLPLWLVSDELYVEFSGQSLLDFFSDDGRFCVVRSFSKMFGLAGLRVGYGVFPSDLAGLLRSVRSPYSVNIIAQQAALEVLRNKAAYQSQFETILSERERLFAALEKSVDITPIPSQANFIFCETTPERCQQIRVGLERFGVSIRFLKTPFAPAAFRITVGTPAENDLFLKSLASSSGAGV